VKPAAIHDRMRCTQWEEALKVSTEGEHYQTSTRLHGNWVVFSFDISR
jgi:hypothetical protein